MTSPLCRLYQRLHDRYGPQGWWPTTPPGQHRPQYYPGAESRPLRPAEQWEIMVGALLTQNTSWRNVEQALAALAERRAIDPEAIAGLEEEELSDLVRPSLYHNQKARRLRHLARYVVGGYGGRPEALLARPAAKLRPELLALPGIGPETADSIVLYAAGQPAFVVDAYTRRICSRLGLADERIGYAALQALFLEQLPAEAALFNEYHALLVRHATACCCSRPECVACCLRRRCRYAKES